MKTTISPEVQQKVATEVCTKFKDSLHLINTQPVSESNVQRVIIVSFSTEAVMTA
jgi:hypothetical protein